MLLNTKNTSSCHYCFHLLFGLLFFNTLIFSAQASDSDTIEIQDPWVRAPAPHARALGGFMLLKNHSQMPIALVEARAEGFDNVMLHQSINEDGMHSMEHADTIVVPAHGEVKFQHGGYHIMLMGPDKKSKPGDEIPLTLVFDNGLEKKVSFIVRKPD